MARKFITEKEMNFINNVTKELLQRFIGQEVIYYAISPEDTAADDVYGEAISKMWLTTVKLNCLVSYDNTTTVTTA